VTLWGDLPASETAAREAANGLNLFEYVREVIARVAAESVPLTPEIICEMNRQAVDGLVDNPGRYRDYTLPITGSRHQPPNHDELPALLDEMCDHAEREAEPIVRAAFVLWRINWIHPFEDGNGRTARAAMYFMLCREAGALIQGDVTVPERIQREKQKYYRCLEEADDMWRRHKVVNVSHLAGFLRRLIRAQVNNLP
jgi:Fic family protein